MERVLAILRQVIWRAPSIFPEALVIVYLSAVQSSEVDEITPWVASAFDPSDDGVGGYVLSDN